MLELVFVKAVPGVPPDDVVAALLVWRLLYLVLPLLLGIAAVVAFERSRILRSPALE